ncbi:MAG: hypothetical protein WC533_03390 [Candidatus Pacearchaeota archaeon]
MKQKNIALVLGDPRLSDFVKKGGKFNQEDIETVDVLKGALNLLEGYNFEYLDNHANLLRDLRKLAKREVDYVVNFCDEGLHNNPLREKDVPEALEKCGLPYTGAGPKCLKLCYDKSAVKQVAWENRVPVSKGFLVRSDGDLNLRAKFPLFVKPNYGDGSFAISDASVVSSYDELSRQVEFVRKRLKDAGHKAHVLVEEFLPGDELSAAIIGNYPKLDVRLIQEDLDVLTKGQKIIGHDAKWNPDSEGWNKLVSIKPKISASLQQTIKDYSARLFEVLGCRDYARFDWRLDKEGQPKLMEANPNCGWCYGGHLTKAFSLGSPESPERKYASVLEKILHAAEERFRRI